MLHRTGKKGLGRSYIEALTLARAAHRGLRLPDGRGPLARSASICPTWWRRRSSGGHDLVIGSRYLQGVSVVNWPLHRLILSTFANRYIRAVTRLPVADCTSGFRCWRREALARVPLERIVSDGYAFLVEMLYEAHRRGCSIGEVPIIFVERRVGHSKMSGGVIFESAYMPWRVVLRGSARRDRRTRRAERRRCMPETVVMVATSYPALPGRHVGTFMEPIAHGVAARGHDVHVVLPWHPQLTRPAREGRRHASTRSATRRIRR